MTSSRGGASRIGKLIKSKNLIELVRDHTLSLIYLIFLSVVTALKKIELHLSSGFFGSALLLYDPERSGSDLVKERAFL